MRILLTGGGTGGHLFPILAVVSAIKKLAAEPVEFLLIGPDDFTQEVITKAGLPFKRILAGKFRRYWSWQNILDLFKIPLGICQALWHVYLFMPDVIFGKGGYASVPAVLVGWLYRIPILIHESDAVPGMANRFLSHLAKRVAVSFKPALKYFPEKKRALVGNPVRQEILKGDIARARETFKLSPDKPVIFITGGSQGSQRMNQAVLEILPELLKKTQIIHQTGEKNYEEVKKKAETVLTNLKSDYHPFPFLKEEMKDAYAVADLIISRAGANSLAEIAAVNKPSILIPLPGAANDHQRENAFEFMRGGAGVVIGEANLKPHLFQEKIISLLDKPDILRKMGQKARRLARLEAASKITQELLDLAKR